jgi:hypothetical protein
LACHSGDVRKRSQPQGCEAALKELRKTALKGKNVKMHRTGADGKRVVEVVNG